jgi:hypothetical protein
VEETIVGTVTAEPVETYRVRPAPVEEPAEPESRLNKFFNDEDSSSATPALSFEIELSKAGEGRAKIAPRVFKLSMNPNADDSAVPSMT